MPTGVGYNYRYLRPEMLGVAAWDVFYQGMSEQQRASVDAYLRKLDTQMSAYRLNHPVRGFGLRKSISLMVGKLTAPNVPPRPSVPPDPDSM